MKAMRSKPEYKTTTHLRIRPIPPISLPDALEFPLEFLNRPKFMKRIILSKIVAACPAVISWQPGDVVLIDELENSVHIWRGLTAGY